MMTNLIRGLVAGLWAGSAAVLVTLVLRLGVGMPTVPELIEDRAISLMPGALFSLLIDTLKFSAKPLFFTGLLLLQVVLAGVLGLLLAPIINRLRAYWPLAALGVGLALWLGTYRVLVPAIGPTELPNRLDTLPTLFGLAVIWLAFGLAYCWSFIRLAPTATAQVAETEMSDSAQPLAPDPQPPTPYPQRTPIVHSHGGAVYRRAAAGAIVAAFVAVGAGTGLRSLLVTRGSSPESSAGALLTSGTSTPGAGIAAPGLGIPGLAPEMTPTPDFYVVSKNFLDPVVDRRTWKLEVGGLVERPFTLDESALHSLPAVTQYATLQCISNEVGGDLIGNALWKGVPLRMLLVEAGVASRAVDLVFHCHDGYADSITIGKAMEPETLCCYEMNGEPLNDKHGAPVRMIIPGIFGMKNAKWVTKIEVVDKDFLGYWQQQGWDDPAPYQTFSRIDVPNRPRSGVPLNKPLTVGGIAFAGDRGVKGVEVSVDAGTTWSPAYVKPALGRLSWSLWSFEWTPSTPGRYSLQVRATDGTGEVQEARVRDPFPKGATGYHTVAVQVAGS